MPFSHFCTTHFYGDEQLYAHMLELHLECPVCKARGLQHQFYRSYRELRHHWENSRSDHFFCVDQTQCPMACFGDDVSWRQHQYEVHSTSLSKQEAKRLLNVTDVFEIRLRDDRRGNGSVGFGMDDGERAAHFGRGISTHFTSVARSNRTTTPDPVDSHDEFSRIIASLPQPPRSDLENRARNREVVDRMRRVLDEDTFAHFRESAQRFREGAREHVRLLLVSHAALLGRRVGAFWVSGLVLGHLR